MLRTLLTFFVLLITALVVLACVAPVKAQCRTSRVAVRVGGYSSYAHRSGYVDVVRVVRRVVALDVPQYYYGTADGYSASLIADAAAYRALKLQVQAQQSYQQQTYAVQQQTYQAPAPLAQPNYQPAPQAVQPQQCETCDQNSPIQLAPQNAYQQQPQVQQQALPAGNWYQQLTGVVQQACVSCHSQKQAGGGVDLSNLQAVPFDVRVDCYKSVVKGRMPKGHPQLPVAHRRLFQLWLQAR